jgi:hypothetical protein
MSGTQGAASPDETAAKIRSRNTDLRTFSVPPDCFSSFKLRDRITDHPGAARCYAYLACARSLREVREMDGERKAA